MVCAAKPMYEGHHGGLAGLLGLHHKGQEFDQGWKIFGDTKEVRETAFPIHHGRNRRNSRQNRQKSDGKKAPPIFIAANDG